MRKIVTALMGTVSGLVLLFSYHTSTTGQAAGVAAEGTVTGDASGSVTTQQPADSSGGVSGTFTGDAVETRFGAVQVEITVEDGVITSSQAIQYPNRDRHDQQINSYAVPVLNSEVVEAQSADIDAVSGATVTSLAYQQSLQAAIDEAFQ